jgi:hypothetical protein
MNPSGQGHVSGAARAFVGGLGGPFFDESINFRGEPHSLVGVGIEVVPDPLCEVFVTLVLGVSDGLDQFDIAPGSAAVFGRTAADDFDQAPIEHTRCGIGEALDLDRVLPAIAEVLEIHEGLCADVLEDVAEPSLARID